MKPVDLVRAEIEKYLARGWHRDVGESDAGRWPRTFNLGSISSAKADHHYAELMAWSHTWHDWSRDHGGELRLATRRIRGISHHDVPTHLTLADPDQAARCVGNGWPAKLERARHRAKQIRAAFPEANLANALRLADPHDDLDLDLALAAARWLADNPDVWPGLTARQVPVAGMHAKWLDTHRALVKTLAGLDELQLIERGTRVYWTYLDPEYRRSGGRVHDSLTLGDSVPLPYRPRVVVIVENKDTAILFPELPGGVAVEGNGMASVGLLPQVGWIATAQSIIYWGDIDRRGFEIVHGLRSRMPQVRTILMDQATFDRYEQYSTAVDERGTPLKPGTRLPVTELTDEERAVYLNLTNPAWTRNRRFEQERIPLAVALGHVHVAIGTSPRPANPKTAPSSVTPDDG